MSNEHNELDYAKPTVDEIRGFAIDKFVREQLREAVFEGLLENAKPGSGLTTRDYIQGAIVARFTLQLEECAALGEDWAGILLAMNPPHTYDQLFGTDEASGATHKALVDALERTISEYVER